MNDPRKRTLRVILFLIAILLLYRVLKEDEERLQMTTVTGQTMGTIGYNIKYLQLNPVNFKGSIDSLLRAFNQSLSTYIPDSEISRLNRSDTLVFESALFYPILHASRQVFDETGGAFDPTIGPLVNIWGFGPDKTIQVPDSSTVQSLLTKVGFDLIDFNQSFATKRNGAILDFGAIAKGYAIDRVANFLERKGVENYMVEIGGEVRAKGQNDKGEIWSIGVEDPTVEDNEQKLLAIVKLDEKSIATSGNYRNYYQRDGRTYAHILDPRTGYNSLHRLLSASVFTEECMMADAYATAFMVMGLELTKTFLDKNSDVEAILIYADEDNELRSFVSEGIAEDVIMNKAL
ncbi:MAG: FAD:protein FMN transferase [Cyclobacteriaceae bacterium]|nr:FAD:protein FMN transferase [Cyclobacteriaceae bacterium HetDA_MAG_MS6]